MHFLLILIISLFLGVHTDKPIMTKEGNVTTVIIGNKMYKSADSEIGEAWKSK